MKPDCTPVRPADNPFASRFIDNVGFDFQWSDSEENYWKNLENQYYRGAIIGKHGSGKTTLLLHTKQQLAQRGIPTLSLFINTENPRLSAQQAQALQNVGSDTVIIFDGADLLSRWHWHRVKRSSQSAKGMIVTSHDKKLLPCLYRTQTDIALLHQVIKRLNVPLTPELIQHSEQLFNDYQGNIREVLRALYWRYSERQ